MTTRYMRGYTLERKVRKQLEDFGWFVIRSAGSHGPVDLVAFRGPDRLFIQCKRARLSREEWSGLVALAREHMATPIGAYPDRMDLLMDHPARVPFTLVP